MWGRGYCSPGHFFLFLFFCWKLRLILTHLSQTGNDVITSISCKMRDGKSEPEKIPFFVLFWVKRALYAISYKHETENVLCVCGVWMCVSYYKTVREQFLNGTLGTKQLPLYCHVGRELLVITLYFSVSYCVHMSTEFSAYVTLVLHTC